MKGWVLMTMTQERPTMSVAEAAKLMGVCAPTMYNITERKDFTALIRVGRKKLILRSRFYEWLEAQAGQADV
jgi:excisionase family DNA binding protein